MPFPQQSSSQPKPKAATINDKTKEEKEQTENPVKQTKGQAF
jgi:hypothetical protein